MKMKRSDIMDDCPEEFEDKLKDIVDYMEGKFGEIKDLLESIQNIDDLDKIRDACAIADQINTDLY